MAFLGEPDAEDVECWPDNWPAFQVFYGMATQWNVSFGGYVGLRYEALPQVLDACGIEKKDRAELLHQLRVMEDEALSVINRR